MGADNWTKCPKCAILANKKTAQVRDNINRNYGKIPQDEYDHLIEKSKEPIELLDTLREDYEIYMTEDRFFEVEYSAACSKCGFKFEFKHKETVEVNI